MLPCIRLDCWNLVRASYVDDSQVKNLLFPVLWREVHRGCFRIWRWISKHVNMLTRAFPDQIISIQASWRCFKGCCQLIQADAGFTLQSIHSKKASWKLLLRYDTRVCSEVFVKCCENNFNSFKWTQWSFQSYESAIESELYCSFMRGPSDLWTLESIVLA